MGKRCVYWCVAAVALTAMTGCPANGITLGTWVFIFNGNTLYQSYVTFQRGGTTLDPYPGAELDGTKTWSQRGGTFTMHQVMTELDIEIEYMGFIESPTAMSGLYEQVAGSMGGPMAKGTWTATFFE